MEKEHLNPVRQNDENGKPIHFFSSLDEMANDNYDWLATLTPLQHLQNATKHIKQLYADDLKRNPTIGNQLMFD